MSRDELFDIMSHSVPMPPDKSILYQDNYTREGLYTFGCVQCQARLEFPFSFNWMVRGAVSVVFPMPETCPVKFCWSCGREFILGKVLQNA